MKQNRTLLITFIVLIVTGALYRLVPYPTRPYGFAPQIAMAIFGGAILQDKKWGFALPLFSMLLSDLLFEGLTRAGVTNMPGFYEGQWLNYLLLAGVTFIGIGMKRITVTNILVASLCAPVLFFLLSNSALWAMHGGYQRPITGAGYFQALIDGVPFFKGSLAGTLSFSALLFGGYALVTRANQKLATA